MRKLIIVIAALFMAQIVYAKNIEVKTGYGYFKDKSGQITDKVRLSPGIYPLNNNGLDYVEVANKQALEAIEVYVEPTSQADLDKEKKQRRDRILGDIGLTEQDLIKIKALP